MERIRPKVGYPAVRVRAPGRTAMSRKAKSREHRGSARAPGLTVMSRKAKSQEHDPPEPRA